MGLPTGELKLLALLPFVAVVLLLLLVLCFACAGEEEAGDGGVRAGSPERG